MAKINLLKETKRKLGDNGKSPKDVVWVGDDEVFFSWEHFEKIADFEYDNGYGAPEIKEGLLVVGKDFWLERCEYDGRDWWEYKSLPSKPKKKGSKKLLAWG